MSLFTHRPIYPTLGSSDVKNPTILQRTGCDPGLNPPTLGPPFLPPTRQRSRGPRDRGHLRPRRLSSDGADPAKHRDQPQQRRTRQTHLKPARSAGNQSRKSFPEPEEGGHAPQSNSDKSKSRAPIQSRSPRPRCLRQNVSAHAHSCGLGSLWKRGRTGWDQIRSQGLSCESREGKGKGSFPLLRF